VITDAAVYRDGTCEARGCSLSDLQQAYPSLDGSADFVWIDLVEPTETELDAVDEMLHVHQLTIEHVLEPHQRPRIDHYADHIFVVLKSLTYQEQGDAVETGEIDVLLGDHYFVTVRDDEQAFAPGQELLRLHPDLATRGPFAALYEVLDAVVDAYEEVAAELREDVEEVEASVFSEDDLPWDPRRINRLKRETLEARRAVIPLREPMNKVVQGGYGVVPETARPFFRDVAEHLTRVVDNLDSIDKLLDNALAAHLGRLGARQNEDMRKLAAYAAMFAAPTLIAGVYGMNFDHMPELGWQYGYPVCLAVMVVVVAVLWRSFKRSGWL